MQLFWANVQTSIGLMNCRQIYVLHLVAHGTLHSLEFGKRRNATNIATLITGKQKVLPLMVIVYACHAADADSTTNRIFTQISKYNNFVTVVGVGACESISCHLNLPQVLCLGLFTIY